MPSQTLIACVESLEQRVTTLEQLPARIDDITAQISQLRDEMHAEFSAILTAIQAGDEETRRVLRGEMRDLHANVQAQFAEQGAQMRTLHEDVIARFALLQEGLPRRSPRSRKKR